MALGKKLGACCAGIALASCSSTVIDGCRIFSPIRGAPSEDTPETQRQVDAHNARGAGACGWKAGA
ncbi:hypothetical protein [Bosea sp. UC22_33]|uniref:hypothetical protein n=1 Tax=Bosea sp. UC22_33 TaxID=3350165 RepID=UPI003672091F